MGSKFFQFLFVVLILLLILFAFSRLNKSNYLFADLGNREDVPVTSLNEGDSVLDFQLSNNSSLSESSIKRVININTKLKEEFKFKIGNDFITPVKSDNDLEATVIESSMNNLLDSVLNVGIATVSFRFKGDKAYLSRDNKTALHVNKNTIKIFNSEEGMTYEGDGSKFYIYDDTDSQFFPYNNGQGFIRTGYGNISFYSIKDKQLVKVDEIIGLKHYPLILSDDNKKFYLYGYYKHKEDPQKHIFYVKVFDTKTRDLMFEKEFERPLYLQSLKVSSNGKLITSAEKNEILIFDEKFDLINKVKTKQQDYFRPIKFLDRPNEKKIAYRDKNGLMIYDVDNHSFDLIETPDEFYVSDVCFTSDSSMLFGVLRYNQDTVYSDQRIVESMLVEVSLDDYSDMKYYPFEAGAYTFEKIDDEIYIRVIRPGKEEYLNQVSKFSNKNTKHE